MINERFISKTSLRKKKKPKHVWMKDVFITYIDIAKITWSTFICTGDFPSHHQHVFVCARKQEQYQEKYDEQILNKVSLYPISDIHIVINVQFTMVCYNCVDKLQNSTHKQHKDTKGEKSMNNVMFLWKLQLEMFLLYKSLKVSWVVWVKAYGNTNPFREERTC